MKTTENAHRNSAIKILEFPLFEGIPVIGWLVLAVVEVLWFIADGHIRERVTFPPPITGPVALLLTLLTGSLAAWTIVKHGNDDMERVRDWLWIGAFFLALGMFAYSVALLFLCMRFDNYIAALPWDAIVRPLM